VRSARGGDPSPLAFGGATGEYDEHAGLDQRPVLLRDLRKQRDCVRIADMTR
jgi:hypothetical protein